MIYTNSKEKLVIQTFTKNRKSAKQQFAKDRKRSA